MSWMLVHQHRVTKAKDLTYNKWKFANQSECIMWHHLIQYSKEFHAILVNYAGYHMNGRILFFI